MDQSQKSGSVSKLWRPEVKENKEGWSKSRKQLGMCCRAHGALPPVGHRISSQ
jgi:hypothetical protein